MKATVKVIELDGAAADIAAVLSSVMTPAAIEAPAEQSAEVEAVVVEDEDDSDEPSASVHPIRPEPAASIGELLEGGPFELAEDIPPAWRWVSANGMTCHIRTQPGAAVAMCPKSLKQIGGRRLHVSSIPFKNTEVCERCNFELVRSRRTA